MTLLTGRLLAIHAALDAAPIEHAFGGAIALAYWTLDPRGTSDIDVNLFTAQEEPARVLAVLPKGIAHDESSAARIKRDGQVRLFWADTPVDLFFSNLPIHDQASEHRRRVPFAGVEIPILGPLELAVFKAMFDRTQDWADLEAMLRAATLDVDALREHLVEMAGEDDPRLGRLKEASRRADAAG